MPCLHQQAIHLDFNFDSSLTGGASKPHTYLQMGRHSCRSGFAIHACVLAPRLVRVHYICRFPPRNGSIHPWSKHARHAAPRRAATRVSANTDHECVDPHIQNQATWQHRSVETMAPSQRGESAETTKLYVDDSHRGTLGVLTSWPSPLPTSKRGYQLQDHRAERYRRLTLDIDSRRTATW